MTLGQNSKKQICGSSVTFDLIQNLVWSKLTSAAQTDLLVGQGFQDSSMSCFSGRFTKFSKFFEKLNKDIGRGPGGKTIQHLEISLFNTLDELLKEEKEAMFLK